MSDIKYTKKASARIIKEVQKINPKAPLSTTFDQAFVLLMTDWDLELGIEKNDTSITTTLYKDGNSSELFKWPTKDAWSEKDCDFNWDFIYRNVLERIIKDKLYKRPKVSKRELNAQRKAAELKAKEEAKAAAKKAKEDAKLAKEKEKADKAAAREIKRLAKEAKTRKRK